MRLGNIELRSNIDLTNGGEYIEIIKWEKNPYYKKPKDESTDFDNPKDHLKVTKIGTNTYLSVGCTKNPETSYTVATIDIKEEPDIRSIGMRAFELNEEDDNNFRSLIPLAYQYAVLLYNDRQRRKSEMKEMIRHIDKK